MFRNALQRFMYGRYGSDQLNLFLLVCYFILLLVGSILRLDVLNVLALLPAGWSLFRLMSRNLSARRAENARFLKLAAPFLRWFRLRRTIRRDKEHRYFKCPHCRQQLRVPRGKGKITVTCRSCGTSFQEKS